MEFERTRLTSLNEVSPENIKSKKQEIEISSPGMKIRNQAGQDPRSNELPKITLKDKILVALAVGIFLAIFIIIVLFGSFGLF
jgi:hypothetical protein